MTDEIKTAIGDLGRAFEEFKSVNDQRLKEIEKKGYADPLIDTKLDKINAALDDAIAQKERLDKIETALKRSSTHEQGHRSDEQLLQQKAFNLFMRKGEQSLTPEMEKALSVGSDPDGGYLVDPDTSGRIVQKIFDTSMVRQYASVQVISTDALEGLHDLDEVGASWVAETQSRTANTTPKLNKWRIPVHELCSDVLATQKLLDDARINVEQWFADKTARKFARAESTAFVTGDGVGKPRGFLTYAHGTTLPNSIEQVATTASGAFKAAPDGGDVFFDVIGKLKEVYRTNANFFMNRSTLAAARKLKDSNGAYIWVPGIERGQASTLAGFGVVTFEDMPDIAADSLSIAFGDLRETYQIVDRFGIRTLRDQYSQKPYVEFYSTKRVGGDVVNFDSLKLIKFAASV